MKGINIVQWLLQLYLQAKRKTAPLCTKLLVSFWNKMHHCFKTLLFSTFTDLIYFSKTFSDVKLISMQ